MSEISKNALSAILGLLCAEQDVGNLKQKYFQELWDSCAQHKTSEISKNPLPGILGLLCAEQNVRNLKNALPGILGLLGAEQNVRNLKKMRFPEFWDSWTQNKTSEISKH